jgi:hypothetical protein
MTSKPRIPTAAFLAAAYLAALAMPSLAQTPAAAPTARAAFDELKTLAGLWQGNVEKPDGPPATVTYELTGGGTAVMEKLFPGTAHEMLSVYFMEGSELVLTHYCAMANQPKMKLVKTTANPTTLTFDFAGGTNFDPAKDTHIHSGSIRIVAPDRVEADWAVYSQGKPAGSNKFFLVRK